jgi:hypothetical protein
MRRTQIAAYHYYVGVTRFNLPGNPRVTKREIEETKFEPKTRAQWDYNGIDERLTSVSEFGNMAARPDFDGPRPDNTTLNVLGGSYKSDVPHFKKLHEHFDEYTKPGSNPKLEAARAVCEHWDASHFYYPGEAWQRNRPSFRSVPAELLNKQTWYHWTDMYTKWHEIVATTRSRQYNPIWPPPGYTKPKFQTKREFVFGVEEPGLLSEIERWSWARGWHENNNRHGPFEILGWAFLLSCMYHNMRENGAQMKWKTMHANQYYPGRQLIRSWGEPNDWETEVWWWQQPLENFPNQGELWYFDLIKNKYIKHIKKIEEEERVARELAAE